MADAISANEGSLRGLLVPPVAACAGFELDGVIVKGTGNAAPALSFGIHRSNRGGIDLEYWMRDFPNASFSPDLIEVMSSAFEKAVATLPHPVSAKRVQDIAESILRTAEEGERDPRTLQAMALVEMQLRSDE